MKDVVIVGGGIAGLTAAWELRDLDAVVLEADDRVGGRVKSFERGPRWVSVGAHMFPGEGSVLRRLLHELELEPARIPGSLLGIAYRGRVVTGGRAETFPFRLPLAPAARISFVRAGLRIKRDAARYNELSRRREGETEADARRRLLGFLDDRSWDEYIGAVHPQVAEIFRATANRMTAEPDEIAAGCMIALFAHVWTTGGVELGFNLPHGPSAFPQELARRLGERVVTGADVTEIARDGDGVRVRYGEDEVRGRCAIVATPAPVARTIVTDLPAETAAALDRIVYGSFVVGGILVDDSRPMPWDDIYSVLTVEKSFNMLFNHTAAGGGLMVYGGAGRAQRLLAKSDAEIADTFTADLLDLYPEAKEAVREVIVQRWERAIPYAVPGRSRVQPALERGVDGTIFFAGDYVGEWTHMESAALTALEAAAAVRARVAVAPVS
jgi:oxygen-dependent protoporphyrinogen oxidase